MLFIFCFFEIDTTGSLFIKSFFLLRSTTVLQHCHALVLRVGFELVGWLVVCWAGSLGAWRCLCLFDWLVLAGWPILFCLFVCCLLPYSFAYLLTYLITYLLTSFLPCLLDCLMLTKKPKTETNQQIQSFDRYCLSVTLWRVMRPASHIAS